MSYNPKQYWENRPNPNAKGHDRAPDFIYAFLGPPLGGKTSILEVGPGLGRMLDLYVPGQRITTIDLSTRYRETVCKRAEALSLSVEQRFLDGPEATFPFDDKEFEIGITVQVLMHIPPEYVKTTVREIIRTTRVSLVVASAGPPPGKKPPHVFAHDYEALFSGLGATVVDFQRRTNTVMLRTENR